MNSRHLSRKSLTVKNVLATAVFVVVGLMVAATPAFANACSGNYQPATTYISDFNSSGTAYSLQSDGQIGPVHGIFGEYDNGQQGACSAIWTSHTSGGWQLDLTSSTQRTFRITLDSSNAVAGTNAKLLGTLYAVARFEDKCYAAGHDPATMTSGQSFQCPAIITQIPSGIAGDTYELSMTGQYASAPETSLVQFQCNGNGSNGLCNDWTIDPVGLGEARLKEMIVTKRTTTTYYEGDFYLTFHVHVTRP